MTNMVTRFSRLHHSGFVSKNLAREQRWCKPAKVGRTNP